MMATRMMSCRRLRRREALVERPAAASRINAERSCTNDADSVAVPAMMAARIESGINMGASRQADLATLARRRPSRPWQRDPDPKNAMRITRAATGGRDAYCQTLIARDAP